MYYIISSVVIFLYLFIKYKYFELTNCTYLDATGHYVVGTASSTLQHAKKLYLVVDLASNGELFDYIITKRRIPEDEARWFFRQIISAVECIFE